MKILEITLDNNFQLLSILVNLSQDEQEPEYFCANISDPYANQIDRDHIFAIFYNDKDLYYNTIGQKIMEIFDLKSL